MIIDRRAFLRRGSGAALVAGAPPVLGRGKRPKAAASAVVNVKAHGAQGDTVRAVKGGSITSGSTTFSQSAAASDTTSGAAISFTVEDVGKVVTVHGAGAGGSVLTAQIVAFVNASAVTLDTAASETAAATEFSYGSDDTAAIAAAITGAGSTGRVYLPAGFYTIRAASNGGQRLLHAGSGGIFGQGGKLQPSAAPLTRWGNSVLVCADASAGLTLTGSARYESFCVDGNDTASLPLQNGTISGNTVVNGGSNAAFVDVWVTASAATGWAIYGAQTNTYHDCGSTNNDGDGLYIDGGASGLRFYHWEESGNFGVAIHGDHLVNRVSGGAGPTNDIHFYSGICDSDALRPCGTKLYLRNAIDWSFPQMHFCGFSQAAGPGIDLDQSAGHGIDLSESTLHALIAASAADPGEACVQISGTPPAGAPTFLKTDGCIFFQGGRSVHVKGDPGANRFSAVGGWDDHTTSGPLADPGMPGVDTMFSGRVGYWQTLTLANVAGQPTTPWTGTFSYRWRGDGAVVFEGSLKKQSVPGPDDPMFTLPLGYRPSVARSMDAIASTGPAIVTVAASGVVSAASMGTGPFPAGATVYLDGLVFGTL